MKKFITKHGIKIVIIFVVIYLGYLGASHINDIFFNRALKVIDDKYKSDITALEDKVQLQENNYKEKSERDKKKREDIQKDTDKKIDNIEGIYKKYKSKTVKELKKKNATIAEVLKEKEKDEVALIESKKIISELDRDIAGILERWAISDIRKDNMHNQIVLNLKMKYDRCEKYTKKLSGMLKKKPFLEALKNVGRGAVIIGSFWLGTKAK